MAEDDHDDSADQDGRAGRHADVAHDPQQPLARGPAADGQRGQPVGRVLQRRVTDPLTPGHGLLDPHAGPPVQPVPFVQPLASLPEAGPQRLGRAVSHAPRGQPDGERESDRYQHQHAQRPPHGHSIPGPERPNRPVAGADDSGAVRQAFAAGAVDELVLDVVPVLLGRGERLFGGVADPGFTPVEVVPTP